jgi:aspartyl/asparaginyl-tRNA synthetase
LSVGAAAASWSVSLDTLTGVKGLVVAKGQGSMTVRDGRSTIQVVITEHTQIAGRRASFASIAVDDVVRLEGSFAADRRLVATRVDVLLAAGNMTVVRRSQPEPDDTVTLVTW